MWPRTKSMRTTPVTPSPTSCRPPIENRTSGTARLGGPRHRGGAVVGSIVRAIVHASFTGSQAARDRKPNLGSDHRCTPNREGHRDSMGSRRCRSKKCWRRAGRHSDRRPSMCPDTDHRSWTSLGDARPGVPMVTDSLMVWFVTTDLRRGRAAMGRGARSGRSRRALHPGVRRGARTKSRSATFDAHGRHPERGRTAGATVARVLADNLARLRRRSSRVGCPKKAGTTPQACRCSARSSRARAAGRSTNTCARRSSCRSGCTTVGSGCPRITRRTATASV